MICLSFQQPLIDSNAKLCVDFQYDAATFDVTSEMKDVFDWDGAIVVRLE